MKERGIIFNGAMVRAILSGQKTQTRRIMKQQPPERWSPVTSSGEPDLQARTYTQGVVDRHGCLQAGPQVFGVADEEWGAVSPFGQPGDRLWVRETWVHIDDEDDKFDGMGSQTYYRASSPASDDRWLKDRGLKWKPSIHMPRHAARILLEITDVRIERLNSISDEDCRKEGCHGGHGAIPGYQYSATPREQFSHLWQSIYGQESWDSNPWVWIYEFKLVPASAGKGTV